MSRRLSILCLTALFLLTNSCFSATLRGAELRRAEDSFYRLGGQVVTPHITWAKPYILGEIKVLVIAPGYTQRETIELAERLGISYTTFFANRTAELGADPAKTPPYELVAGITKEEKDKELQEKLKADYDVIIIGMMNWNAFSNEQKYQILLKVKEGSGLVFDFMPGGTDEIFARATAGRTTDKDGFILTGIPFRAISVFGQPPSTEPTLITRVPDFLKLSEFGKGRIAILDYAVPSHWPRNQCLTPVTSCNPEATALDYEYFMSLAIKTILWSARKEPPVLIKELSAGAAPLRWETIAGERLSVKTLSAAGEPEAVTKLVIRNDRALVEYEKTTESNIRKGEDAISFSLPELPDGCHFADVFIKRGNQTINWGTLPLTVTSASRIGAITLEKESYARNETLKGTVLLENNSPEPLELVLEISDNLDRLLARKTLPVPAQAKSAGFNFGNIQGTATVLNHVTATLRKNNREMDSRTADFAAPDRSRDDFCFIPWAGYSSNDYVYRQLYRQFYDLGIDAALSFDYQPHLLAVVKSQYEANVQVVPYATRMADEYTDSYGQTRGRTNQDNIRMPCVNDPKYQAELKRQMEGIGKALGKYGPPGYSLGDENMFVAGDFDLCFCPYCNQDFARFLKEQYRTLEALNKEWGTACRDWTEAKPMTISQAKTFGNYAPWADHRLHMDSSWAGIHRYARTVLEGFDDQARVGGASYTQIPSVYSAADYQKIMDACGFVFPYSANNRRLEPATATVRALVRSFKKEGSLTGWVYGGYNWPEFFNRTEDVQRWHPWAILFNGGNGAVWFAAYGTAWSSGGAESGFAPDLTPFPIFKQSLQEVREIRAGIGRLLLASKRLDDGIAIHYSQSSLYAGAIDSQLSSVLDKKEYLERYIQLVEDLGLNYNFVSYRQLEQGELSKKGYKVFLLPYSQAMSAKETAAVREFVKQGGMVIADFRPAVMDEHCRATDKGMLDDVFGITRNGLKVSRRTGEIKLRDGATVVMPSSRMEANIKPAGAEPMAVGVEDIPAIMVNHYGKGLAVYLNFAIDGYRSSCEDDAGKATRDCFKKLLAMGGVDSRIRITSGEERNLRSLQRISFANGAVEYLGLLRDIEYMGGPKDKTAKEITLHFPRKVHLYDVREKKYLGFTDTQAVAVTPARAKLYALLPYVIKEIRLGGIRKSYNPGDTVNFKVTLSAEGGSISTHAVRIEVLDPSGNVCRPYARNLIADKGAASGEIRLALNDPPGKWTIRAVEVVSGKSAELACQVRPGPAR